MQRTVTVIPQTIHPLTQKGLHETIKRRVAAYARVSTNSEEQLTSYEAQVDYYTNYIKSKSEWNFAGIYTDEGISATNTKHRDGFNQMIADALAGKIDLIVTKSVSRFARNTVDSLVTVRKLKEHGVEVYFEKENIYTLDSKGELLITIMSSLAQEESRSMSENVTWGQRKRFADGKVSLAYKTFLGYRKGEDGLPEIVEAEAEIVRRIYREFISGKTGFAIAKGLTEDGIPTPSNKTKWRTSTVESILTNEKYKGAALLQKTFTVDFLQKKMKINEGEVPQYYIEHSHKPIIDPQEFDAVQREFQRRKTIGRSYSGSNFFSSRLICADCGEFYGPKIWHSTSRYRKVVWQCNKKFDGERQCQTPHLDEKTIKEKFTAAFNRLLLNKDGVLEDCRVMQSVLTDCTEFDQKIESLMQEITEITALTRVCVEQNAVNVQNQQEFEKRYNGYVERYEKAKAQVEELQLERDKRESKATAIGGFMFEISEFGEPIQEFSGMLWIATVDSAKVQRDGRIKFTFQSGVEIEV